MQADIFAPCALGAIINDKTIPQLKVEIVAGAANNQLLEERHGDELEQRNILYAPDYVANAGGVINVYSELAGWTSARSFRKADEIYDTILQGVRDRASREDPDVSRRGSPRRAAHSGRGLDGAHVAAVAEQMTAARREPEIADERRVHHAVLRPRVLRPLLAIS